MKALLSVFHIRCILLLQYRMAAIAGIATQFFFGLVMVMVFEAFFRQDSGNLPMNFPQTVTYIWLGQGLLRLLPWNGDRDVQKMIRSGDFAYELLRPISVYQLWYARIFAQRLAPTTLCAPPLFLMAVVCLPMEYQIAPPASVFSGFAFALTLMGSVLLGCAISNLITLSVLFTIGDGVERLVPAIVLLFSGMIIPLAYFPDWLQPLFRWLPFSGLVDTPYRFYLGLYGMPDIGFSLAHQVVWTLLLVAIGQWMVSKATRRTVIQGG